MEKANFDYQKESRKGGVLESASKRVRMIFSVMASPNRIDILRILNTKGPLTYSELKALAGFKSKKESGKFAYHLRKLLRQLLVALNKAERRYTITNLGKLVLSLARQIEERSIIESGKMYVRTSRHTIEEFNSHKIIQSLVREANLPLEQAHKITEEVENKIYKFQTAYLTSSLIRETVNSVLIEHGYEEYRNKLSRLGLPSSDILTMLSNDEELRNGLDGLMSKIAGRVFSEHLVFNILPKDIADMHLAGELHISNSGVWNLLPDTIFIDTMELEEGLDLKGKYLHVSRLPAIKNPDDIVSVLPALISLLSREASNEVVLQGIIPAVLNNNNVQHTQDISTLFARTLVASSAAPSHASNLPMTTIAVPIDSLDSRHINAILSGYSKYVELTPMPRIGLCLVSTNSGNIKDSLNLVAAIVQNGGIVSIGNNLRANSGICKSLGRKVDSVAAITLHSLSINLPRLAYESNKDETYFRAKLALLLKPALAAMSMRKKTLIEYVRRGLLPAFAFSTQMMQRGTSSIVINLTGANESIYKILGYEPSSGNEILQKVLKTAVEVAGVQGKQLGEDAAGVAMISDESGIRFAALDSEKYGKISLLQSHNTHGYSQGMTLNGNDLLSAKANFQECIVADNLLNGGFATLVDLTHVPNSDIVNALELALDLPFFRPRMHLTVCEICGRRSKASVDRCEICKSPYSLQVYT
jgi:ribonucleoside-triphosphate reductase